MVDMLSRMAGLAILSDEAAESGCVGEVAWCDFRADAERRACGGVLSSAGFVAQAFLCMKESASPGLDREVC
jgi:hypothetical protein